MNKPPKKGIVGEPTEETIFLPYTLNSSLIGKIEGYMCKECTAKYGTAVNFAFCPFCRRRIARYQKGSEVR